MYEAYPPNTKSRARECQAFFCDEFVAGIRCLFSRLFFLRRCSNIRVYARGLASEAPRGWGPASKRAKLPMSLDSTSTGPVSSGASSNSELERVRRGRLQKVGSVLFGVGLALAGLTYWIETQWMDPSAEELLPSVAAANRRQMGILYGNSGATIFGWLEALKRPDVTAALIVLAFTLAAAVCFHVARLPDPVVSKRLKQRG
jgi:hypothetical protein